MTNHIPRWKAHKLKELLAGYDKIADAGEEITDEAVAEARDISEDNARRQKKFFRDIGVLEKDGWDYYLTEEGEELGSYLRFNQDEPAKEVFKELLSNWEHTREILSYFDSEGMQKRELMDKIGFVTSTELTGDRKEWGAEAVADLYEWTGIIVESEDERYYLPDDTPEEEVEEEFDESQEEQSTPNEVADQTSGSSAAEEVTGNTDTNEIIDEGRSEQAIAPNGVGIQTGGVEITLELSGDDDPENVRQLLLAIRAGTEESIEEYETTDKPANE